MSESKLAAFLGRAKVLTDKEKDAEQSKISVLPSRSISISPFSSKKTSTSPVSIQSCSTTHDGTPQPAIKKVVLSGTFSGKKTLSVNAREKADQFLVLSQDDKGPEDKLSANEKLTVVAENKKPSLGKQAILQTKTEKPREILSSPEEKALKESIDQAVFKNKQKLEKILEIFKVEAHKADQKFKKLREENSKLREILQNPQLSQIKKQNPLKSILEIYSKASDSCEFGNTIDNLCLSFKNKSRFERNDDKVLNWFECLGIHETKLHDFLTSICKKLLQEQQKRLKTEEEIGKMIEFEENLIRELELKVNNASVLARKASSRLIADDPDIESCAFFSLDKST